jgi:PucR C-terminal helix-turn-helix domain/GGDEF-like domain
MSAVTGPAYDRAAEHGVPAIPVPSASDPLAGLIETLEARRDEVIDRGLHRIRSEIPEYRAIVDPAFVEDVRAHVALHHDAMMRSVAEGRPLDRDELGFMRARATRRVGRIPLAAFLQAFRIYQEEFWDALLSSADGDAARNSAMEAAGTIIRYINTAAAEAGEVYLEAERLLHAQGERVRRDLLEDLLAGRPPAPGPKLTAARAAGLVAGAPCIVIAAHPLTPPQDERQLRSAAVALTRAVGSVVPPLAVVRHEEVVVVPCVERSVAALIDALETVQEQLAGEGFPLAIGVSTVQDGLDRMPEAYGEAVNALARVNTSGGVVALPALTAFDCLALFGPETARRRIPSKVRQFVLDDLAEDRVLTTTLLEYVASNLNTKVAAERLFVHPNTARYRLGKIEERTGCDLRCFADVLDVLIALRVHGG